MARHGRAFPSRRPAFRALHRVGDSLVAGSLATETDSGFTGAATVTVAGALGTESDTAFAGAVARIVVGSQATESDSAFTGSVAAMVAGSQGTETDTANAGTAGSTSYYNVNDLYLVDRAEGGYAGTYDDFYLGKTYTAGYVSGSQAVETDTAFGGSPRFLNPGSLATETDAATAGVPQVLTPGSLATETDVGLSGTPLLLKSGSLASSRASVPDAQPRPCSTR